jgi:hypothetical protein
VSPYAVIDVGSNTIHLLVGEVKDGAVLPGTGEKVSSRLGSGVDSYSSRSPFRFLLRAFMENRRAGHREARNKGQPSSMRPLDSSRS